MAKTNKKLTKQERRLIVLKDALSQVNRGFISPSPGTLCDLDRSFTRDLEQDIQLQKVFTSKFLKEAKCKVCQRGALLVSTIRKENSFKFEDFDSINATFYDKNSIEDKRLLKLFSENQIALMEAAFEVENAINNYDNEEDIINYADEQQIEGPLEKKQLEKAMLFGIKYKDARDRQIAIFKNSIKNGGIFKP